MVVWSCCLEEDQLPPFFLTTLTMLFSVSNEEQIGEHSAVGTFVTPSQSSLSLAEQFPQLIENLRDAKNKPATLRRIYVLCFGEHEDMPDYGYFGKAAKQVGGAGRLAELMWLQVTSPPKGDILAYLMGRHKGHKVSTSNGGTSAVAAFIQERQLFNERNR